MAQVVKTRVGDDSRLVAELAAVAPGQRLESAAVPFGNVGSGHGGFPRGVGVQGRCSMPLISPRPPVVQNSVNADRSAQLGDQTIVGNTGGRGAADCRRQPSWRGLRPNGRAVNDSRHHPADALGGGLDVPVADVRVMSATGRPLNHGRILFS